jgi:hypothetical protein
LWFLMSKTEFVTAPGCGQMAVGWALSLTSKMHEWGEDVVIDNALLTGVAGNVRLDKKLCDFTRDDVRLVSYTGLLVVRLSPGEGFFAVLEPR